MLRVVSISLSFQAVVLLIVELLNIRSNLNQQIPCQRFKCVSKREKKVPEKQAFHNSDIVEIPEKQSIYFKQGFLHEKPGSNIQLRYF